MHHKKGDPGQLISNMHSLALLTKKISWMSGPIHFGMNSSCKFRFPNDHGKGSYGFG